MLPLHRIALPLGLALVLLHASAAEARTGVFTLASAAEERTFRAEVAAGSTVDVSVIQGDIRVEPAAGDEVEVVARRGAVEAPPIQVLWLPGADSVIACTSYAGDGAATDCALGRERELDGTPNPARVDFTVRLPHGVSLRARTVNGDVLVEGFRGAVTAHSVTGQVVVQRGRGAVDARSLSGDVELAAVESSRLTLETLSGDIQWSGVPRAGDDLRMNSYSGEIRLAPGPGSDATLQVDIGPGRLSTSLPLRRTDSDDTGRERYRLVLGSGEGSLRVVTRNGDVVIRPPVD